MEHLFFETSPWFILLCLIIALLYAFILYFRDKKLEISKSKKYIFASLRFLSTFLIALLFLNPFYQKITTKIDKPKIILLVDNSKSIKLIYDDTIADFRQNIENASQKVSKNFKTEKVSFDKQLNDTFNLQFDGQTTNISKALKQISDDNYNQNVGALVLISDGIYNSGIDPVYYSETLPFSVYTVGVGDTASYSDIEVKNLKSNEYVFLNNEFPIEVTIDATKLKNKNFTISISDKNKNLIAENVKITNNDFVYHKIYYIKADKSGLNQYKCKVSRFKNEHNYFNNTKILTVNVLKNKQKILFLTNNISPDIAAFRRVVDKNQNFSLDVQMINKFKGNISDSISMLVLYNLPSKSNNIKKIFQKAKEKAIPFIIILGTQTDYKMLNAMNIGYNAELGKILFDDVHGAINPSFKTFEINSDLNKVLTFSPPMKSIFSTPKTDPNLEVVLYQSVKGVQTDRPLVLINDKKDFYPANYAIIAAENFWALRMYDYKLNENTDLFDDFLMQIIQFVGVKKPQKNLIVKVNHTNVQGDDIIFKAEVYDRVYQLINKNDVKLNIKDSSQNQYQYVFSKVGNAYELNIGSLSEGKYTYTASTVLENKPIRESGIFYVLKSDKESQNLQANFEMLQKISSKTGGKFLTYQKLDSLNEYLQNDQSIVPVSFSSKSVIDIGDFKWIFFIILFILALEWGLRKFYGTY